MKEKIKAALEASFHYREGGLIASIGNDNIKAQDIPRIAESFSLLAYFVEKLPIYSFSGQALNIEPCIILDKTKLVLMLHVNEGSATHVCHWLFDTICSPKLRDMAGIVAVPFVFAQVKGELHIVPDWFFVFYPEGGEFFFVPAVISKSVLSNDDVGEEWASFVVGEMNNYCLPTEK